MNESFEHEMFMHAATYPVCYHGVLLIATVQRALMSGKREILVDRHFHRGEALRHMNILPRDPKSQTNDGTIAAIAFLATFEVT